MTIQRSALLFSLLISFQNVLCMINHDNTSSSHIFTILVLPELAHNCMSNLDYKSNMCLIMTCKELYQKYVNCSDILFTKHHLQQSDYMDAMIYFSRKKDKEKVELLIRNEGPYNKKDREDICNFLHCSNSTNEIMSAYEERYDNNRIDNKHLKEILMNCDALFRLRCQQGCDVNVWDECGWTLFDDAMIDNDAHFLRRLLLIEASFLDRNIKNKMSIRALSFGFLLKRTELLKLLLADPYINYNIQDDEGYTVLHEAVLLQRTELLKFLLSDPSVNRNIQNNYGRTALHLAVMLKKTELLKILLADPFVDRNIQDNYGCTALHRAAMLDYIKQLRLLLADPFVDCNIQNNAGYTAYFYAENPEAITLLAPRTFFLNKYPIIRGMTYDFVGVAKVLTHIGCGVVLALNRNNDDSFGMY